MRALFLIAAVSITCAAALPAYAAERWIGTWASSQQIPEPQNALALADLQDATLREVVHVSIGGRRVRVRLSNAFGTSPLRVASAHLARSATPGSAAIVVETDRALSFEGRAEVVIPAGADYWSDPVDLTVPALSDLTLSLYLPIPPERQTGHPGAHATTYHVHGDHTAAADLPGAQTVEHWYVLSGVEVASDEAAHAVVTLGDSITDGHGSTTDRNDRWPDDLARRLQADPAARHVAVLNEGIGGNRLLLDGTGPNVLARFDRDVLSQAGVHTVILLEGINDLGVLTRDHPVPAAVHAALVQAVIASYAQIIARAHAHNLRVLGATILPDAGSDYYHPDASNEQDRQAVNDWIRAPGHFDGVIDFDLVTRDPADHTRLQKRFDSGDHLHPSPAGYLAMAAAIPLDLVR
ncbi:MAG: SGNH/GDSL hydrolase family protein [Caulobacteraceae bacterium]